MDSPPQSTPSSSSDNGRPLAVDAKHTPPGRKNIPPVPMFRPVPRKVTSVVSRPPVKADGIPKASNVVTVPFSTVEGVFPTPAWYMKLQFSLKSVSSLTSVSDATRQDAIKAHRLPDCMLAHSCILSDEDVFRRWHMRYSEDNMNLIVFHPNRWLQWLWECPLWFHL